MRGPESWLSRERCLAPSTVIRLQSFNYEFHDDGWRWWEAHDSWQISETADEVVYGRNCFCSALFYRGLKAAARELIQIIHKSIHENGNRQWKQNRASNRVDCSLKRNRLLITFEVEAIEEKPWSSLSRSTTRLSTSTGWVFELWNRTSYAHLHFSILSLLSRWFCMRHDGRDISLSD